MPELPEVEVVRRGLAPAVTGAHVVAVTVRDDRALTRHPGSAAQFESTLTGAALGGPVRRGKFLWIPLTGRPDALVGHLGMSGQILLRPSGAPVERFERVRIDLVHPVHGELVAVFADQRTFGSLAIDPLVPTADGAPGGLGSTAAKVPAQVSHIARDPMDPAFDETGFRAVLARRHSAIKRVLLDQTTVSGIGNIYADEALWGARIHPETSADALPTRRVRRLLGEVRIVLEKALSEGGTSFDAQYVDVNGRAGYFAHSLSAYGRTGRPCPRCGRGIVRERFMNRSSHFCPRCQRPAR